MQSAASDFAFIGARDYVHAPTMFEAFRARITAAAGAAEPGDFSFRFLRVNQTVRANGVIAVAPADAPRPAWGRPAAEIACSAAGHSWYAALYDRDATPIERRVPAREKTYIGAVDLEQPFTGEAALQGIRDNDDLFQALVEANKQVHLKTLTGDPLSGEVRFRFVYCLDYACAPEVGGGAGRVRIASEGLRDAGDYLFSLTRLELHLGAYTRAFKLCFASADMKRRMQSA